MELGLTIPLQRHLKIRTIPYGDEANYRFCWDLHIISLRSRPSLLAVHCQSRYVVTLFDLHQLEWTNLERTFIEGLRQSLQAIGISTVTIADYLQQAGPLCLTKTHGRSEVAYLNRAWEDVLSLDYTLDQSSQAQPLLDHAVNTKPCRCAGVEGLGMAEDRLLQSL